MQHNRCLGEPLLLTTQDTFSGTILPDLSSSGHQTCCLDSTQMGEEEFRQKTYWHYPKRQFFDWIFDKRQPRRNPYNHSIPSLLDLHTVPTIPSLLDLQVRPTKPFHQILSWFNHSDTQYAPSNSHQRNILAEVRPHFTPLHWRNNLPEFRPYSAPTRHYIRPYGSRNNPQNGSSSSANRHLRPDPQSNNAHNNQSVNHTPLHKSSTIQGPLHQTPPRQAVADLSPAANHGPSITSPATTPASTPHSTPRKKRAQKMYYLIFPLHLSFQ